MMEVVVTTGAVRRAKLRSSRHHQQTTSTDVISAYWICFTDDVFRAIVCGAVIRRCW